MVKPGQGIVLLHHQDISSHFVYSSLRVTPNVVE